MPPLVHIPHHVSTAALDIDDFSVILNPRNRAFQLQTEAYHPDRNREGKGCDKLEERNGKDVGDSVSRRDANRQGRRQEVKG